MSYDYLQCGVICDTIYGVIQPVNYSHSTCICFQTEVVLYDGSIVFKYLR